MTYEKKDPSQDNLRQAEEEVKYYKKLIGESEEVQEGMRLLEKQRGLNLTTIKESCKVELQRFISMRGTIDPISGKVHLPLMTVSDHNAALTMKKMKEANDLTTLIDSTNSLDELHDTLQKASISGSDLEFVIGKCLLITEVAKSNNPSNYL